MATGGPQGQPFVVTSYTGKTKTFLQLEAERANLQSLYDRMPERQHIKDGEVFEALAQDYALAAIKAREAAEIKGNTVLEKRLFRNVKMLTPGLLWMKKSILIL